MHRSEVESEITLGLPLSSAERVLIDNVAAANEGVVAIIRETSKRTVRLSIAQLDELADAVSATANQTESRVLQRKLDTLVRKIDRLTGSHLQNILESKAPGAPSAGSQKPK